MIPARNPTPHRHRVLGYNVVKRRDGSEVHLDDIATSAEGLLLMEEVEATVLAIEAQIRQRDDGDDDWLARAEVALKKSRRIRSPLQQRIAELRRAEERAARLAAGDVDRTACDGPKKYDLRRSAFINAARERLGYEVFVEIWQRASEMEPAAFEGWGGVRS